MRKALPVALIAIAVIIIIIAAVGAYKFNFTDSDIHYQACTMEAKICSDGSAVGRTGPNCEFEECPTVNTSSLKFGSFITFEIDKPVTFSDGLKVELKKISDSRCPPNANCIWAGDLEAVFNISGGKVVEQKEITLILSGSTDTSVKGYAFTIKGGSSTQVQIQVLQTKEPTGGCYIGGCSSQICSDQKDAMSTCEFREEYSCYKTATCERQQGGECGWTENQALSQCLANYQ